MSLLLTLVGLSLCYFSPGEVFPSLAPYHIQQLLLVPAVFISLPGMVMRRWMLPTPQCFLMIGLWFGVVASLLTRFWIRGSFDAFLDFGVIVAFYFLVVVNGFKPSRVKIICGTILFCSTVMSIQGILAFHVGYEEDRLLHISIEGTAVYKRIRGYGILNDANDLAQFLLVGLAMLGVFWRRRSFVMNVILLGPPAAVLIYGIYLTGSRGAMFGLAVIVFVLASSRLTRMQSMLLAGFVFALMIVGNFGGGRQISVNEASAAGRVVAWGTGLAVLRSSPIFGVGFTQFTEINDLTAHNSFVLCFAELGFFGYFFWLSLIITAVIGLELLRKVPLKEPEDYELRRCVTTVRSALYCFLATSWFLSRTYNITFYVLIALAGALFQYYRQPRAEIVLPMRHWVKLTVAAEVISIVLIYTTIRVRSF